MVDHLPDTVAGLHLRDRHTVDRHTEAHPAAVAHLMVDTQADGKQLSPQTR